MQRKRNIYKGSALTRNLDNQSLTLRSQLMKGVSEMNRIIPALQSAIIRFPPQEQFSVRELLSKALETKDMYSTALRGVENGTINENDVRVLQRNYGDTKQRINQFLQTLKK